MPSRSSLIWAGTYARFGGEGLYAVETEPRLRLDSIACQSALNASFGAWSRRFGLMYLVDESDQGAIGVFRLENSKWICVGRSSAAGSGPCFLSLSPDEGALAVANYTSGTLALFFIDPETGLLNQPPIVRANRGSGPNHERQAGPHAHCARFTPDGRWLYQTDLGTDEVLAFAYDPLFSGLDEGGIAYESPPGAGPRHVLFDPSGSHCFLLSELANTLTVCSVADGVLNPQQEVSTLPSGFGGENVCGHLEMSSNGNRLYVSNRGHDSIAVFAVHPPGQIELLQHIPSGGSSPRFFLLREHSRELLVAHEKSQTITRLPIRPDGNLGPVADALHVPGVAFLLEIPSPD